MLASAASALAISTSCCSATESEDTPAPRIDLHMHAREHMFGALAHRFPVHKLMRAGSRPRQMFSATVRRRHERKFLENRGNAIGAGRGGRRNADRRAILQDRARVGLVGARDDFDQSRFAATVFAEEAMDLVR